MKYKRIMDTNELRTGDIQLLTTLTKYNTINYHQIYEHWKKRYVKHHKKNKKQHYITKQKPTQKGWLSNKQLYPDPAHATYNNQKITLPISQTLLPAYREPLTTFGLLERSEIGYLDKKSRPKGIAVCRIKPSAFPQMYCIFYEQNKLADFLNSDYAKDNYLEFINEYRLQISHYTHIQDLDIPQNIKETTKYIAKNKATNSQYTQQKTNTSSTKASS